MSKKTIIITLIVVILIVAVGIVSYKLGENNSVEKTEDIGKNGKTTMNYTIDNEMDNHNSKYSERGVYYNTLNQPNAPHYYTIAMGEKNHGGYSIKIEKVNIDDNKNVEVIVKEDEPTSLYATMAITYPTCMIKLDKYPTTFIVKNAEGETFENINF